MMASKEKPFKPKGRSLPYMKITAVQVIPFEAPVSGGMVRAYAEVELEGKVRLRGIQVIETEKGGWYLSYPTVISRKGKHDVIVFQDIDLKDAVRRAVLDELRGEGEPESLGGGS